MNISWPVEIVEPVLPPNVVLDHGDFVDLRSPSIFLVADKDRTYGYVTQDTVDEMLEDGEDPKFQDADSNPGRYAKPIPPDQLVPGSTSLLDLMPLFTKHRFFFVLTRNEIKHVVSFEDMDDLPVMLCFFALFMELEGGMIRLLTGPVYVNWALPGEPSEQNRRPLHIDAMRRLNSLHEARLRKACELCDKKYRSGTPAKLLRCTTFIDKKTMFMKDEQLASQLPYRIFDGNEQATSFFNRLERARNQIAHSDSILRVLDTPKVFNDFVNTLQKTIARISELREAQPLERRNVVLEDSDMRTMLEYMKRTGFDLSSIVVDED